ncbi:sigma-70 family RNA polymerase sigma factor [Pimelobacter simplex]|uniref:sigma-70 family RNA polymerase sigma factor n=1 Tax=Nocardioides simplex TaxID=2045 RepID=UPI003AB02BEB
MNDVPLEDLTEGEIVAAARAQVEGAKTELFRRHWRSGVVVATKLVGPDDAEDLVADAFAKIFDLFDRGKGPELAFRPYLMATLRTLRADRFRAGREVLVADFEGDRLEPTASDGADQRAEAAVLARAFGTLPERWQLVLWHTAVEEEPHQQVAHRLGLNPNAVAALAFRAREGLRRAYLAEHLEPTRSHACRTVLDQLPGLARGALKKGQAAEVHGHVATCPDCTRAVDGLAAINSRLGAALLPAVAGVPVLLGAVGAGDPSPPETGQRVATRLGIAAGVLAVIGALVLLLAPEDDTRPTAGEPTASPSVSASASASAPAPAPAPPPVPPSVPATPAPTPAAPRPTPSPSPTPPAPRVALAFGRLTTEVLTREPVPQVHVTFPVTATSGPLEVELHLENVAEHAVHSDQAFARWTCRRPGPSVLVCRLPDTVGRAVRTLGIDVVPRRPGALSIAATLRFVDAEPGSDPVDRTTIRIPRVR